ncbi:MAG: hypothetical protein JEZ06_15495 [Anaerolineaceae bacterium]|nr:hypothetical protein [Anaerolineaceae bacterium]
MTNSSAEEYRTKINSIESDFREFNESVQLPSKQSSLNDLNAEINQLSTRLTDLRTRGYAFEKNLENEAKQLLMRWRRKEPGIKRKINQESQELEADLRKLEPQVRSLASLKNNPTAARSRLPRLESTIKNLESKISAAETSIQNMISPEEREYGQLDAIIKKAEWALEQIDEASFTLLATESIIQAVEATWIEGKEDKSDPKGILYLTDQRMLFEQKQEIAKKKVLFITTDKEMVQKMIFEVPVALVEEAKPEKQGMLKNQDHLFFTFGSGANLGSAHVHIFHQDCKDWQSLIKKARQGDFDQERAIEIDTQVEEKLKEAPSECPQCSGAITQPILRGQDTINCEYCGFVIRL